jgi:lipopolysaccharide transport system ATP-binding protein
LSVAIKVENLSKQYRIGRAGSSTLIETLKDGFGKVIGSKKSVTESDDTFWALRDVSFEVGQGDVVGIIGKNGAGKSTLLKILSRIIEPTTGRVEINGRVASLLEVGTGFHPELTGRENIYLNGAILGMKRAEIKARFDEIVDFSGVEKFIDTPVKHYSSGMYVRLAFAVAAHLEPEILIIDEVLAVGDKDFQDKCLNKMKDVSNLGRTVIFVSHNMTAIRNFCKNCLYLANGNIILNSNVDNALNSYLNNEQTTQNSEWTKEVKVDGIEFVNVRLVDESGNTSSHFSNLKETIIELRILIKEFITDIKVGITLEDAFGTKILTTFHNDMEEKQIKEGLRVFLISVPKLWLNEGTYYISLLIGIHKLKWILDERRIISFNVEFSTMNRNKLLQNKRNSIFAPILKWDMY